MDKQMVSIVVHEILFGSKKERTGDACRNIQKANKTDIKGNAIIRKAKTILNQKTDEWLPRAANEGKVFTFKGTEGIFWG
jgi:hypothetical protein